MLKDIKNQKQPQSNNKKITYWENIIEQTKEIIKEMDKIVINDQINEIKIRCKPLENISKNSLSGRVFLQQLYQQVREKLQEKKHNYIHRRK